MNILRKAIYNLIRWSQSIANEPDESKRIGISRNTVDSPGMNFTVFNAIGGKVIQFNQYNPVTDRHKQQLYIVTDKEDLGAELGQIITVESLGR